MINLAVSSLSLYLAYALSDFGKKSGESEEMFLPLLMIISCTLLVSIIGKLVSIAIFMSINRNIHDRAINGLVKTGISFFDENTSGRIINRFSKDITVTDKIVFHFLEMIDFIIKCLFSLVFIMLSQPITVIFVIMQLCYFGYLRRRILNITRQCFAWI